MKFPSELITGTDGRSWRREELRELSRISQRRRSAASIRRGREERGHDSQRPVHVGRRDMIAESTTYFHCGEPSATNRVASA